MTEKNNITIHTKTWFQDENGDTIFGFGRLNILETINRTGSISAAAKELKMGYRSMWGKLKKTEERLGIPLLIRTKGGMSGGKSILTPEAKIMVERFKELQRQIDQEAAQIYKEIYINGDEE